MNKFEYKKHDIKTNQNTTFDNKKTVKSISFFDSVEKKRLVKKLAPEELMAFCRQMYSLFKSNVPVLNALNCLLNSTKTYSLQVCLKNIITDVSNGQNLSQAFSKHPDIFGPVIINIIEAGEHSGKLELSFMRISEYLEFELKTTRQFKSVLRYPITVISASIIAVGVLVYFVIPTFSKLFSGFKTALPLPTRVLIGTSHFFTTYWLYIFIAILLCIFLSKNYINTPKGRLFFDTKILKIPIFGSIIEQILLLRFSRTLAMVIQSDVPIAQGLFLASKVVNNAYLSSGILTIRDSIEHGETIAKAAAKANIFSPMLLQMLSIGEETGSLEYLLLEIANYYDGEVKYSLSRLSEAIEPILMTFIGGLVLFLALGIFLPMWNMISFTGIQ